MRYKCGCCAGKLGSRVLMVVSGWDQMWLWRRPSHLRRCCWSFLSAAAFWIRLWPRSCGCSCGQCTGYQWHWLCCCGLEVWQGETAGRAARRERNSYKWSHVIYWHLACSDNYSSIINLSAIRLGILAGSRYIRMEKWRNVPALFALFTM